MTAPGATPPPATQVVVIRTQADPVATFALIAVSLFLLTTLAIVWRSLIIRLEMEATYEATLVEAAERSRLVRLDAATLRQQLQTVEQDISDLRAAIPSAADAQAELVRYGLYAAESGVSAATELRGTVRYERTDPAFPDLLAQRWTVAARGSARDTIRFMERIATGRYASWHIENLVLKPDDTLGASEWDVVTTADVVIYSYPP